MVISNNFVSSFALNSGFPFDHHDIDISIADIFGKNIGVLQDFVGNSKNLWFLAIPIVVLGSGYLWYSRVSRQEELQIQDLIRNCVGKTEAFQEKFSLSALQTIRKYIPKEHEYLRRVDLSSLMDSNPNIALWLNRITAKYTGESGDKNNVMAWERFPHLRPAIAKKTMEILEYAKRNPTFYEEVVKPRIDDSLTDCSDSTVYHFNEMAKQQELYLIVERFQWKQDSFQNLLQTFKKYFPVALVEESAKESIEERIDLYLKQAENALNPITKWNLQEQVEILREEPLEVVLDFLIRFQEDFRYPLAISVGKFNATGREDRKEFLQRAKQKIEMALRSEDSLINYLISENAWKSLLKKEESWLLSALDCIDEETDQALNNDRMYALLKEDPQEYHHEGLRIKNEGDARKRALFQKATVNFLTRNRALISLERLLPPFL